MNSYTKQLGWEEAPRQRVALSFQHGLLALGVAGFFWFANPSDDNESLYGEWTIDKKVEKTLVTNMVFREDGLMSLGNEAGVVYDDCTYELFTRGTIDFTCTVNGRQGTFPLEVNLDQTLITDTKDNMFTKSWGRDADEGDDRSPEAAV